MQRIDMEFNNIDETVLIVLDEFSFLSLNKIREAIRLGSLAQYGRTYKLNTQEVCFWIRKYIESNKNKLGI